MDDWLIDTNVLVDFLRQNPSAKAFWRNLPRNPATSVMATMELYAGVRTRREEADTAALIANMRLLPVTPEIAQRAGVFLRLYLPSHSIDTADAIIAATAEHHGLKLATLNVKHFPMLRKLKPAY
jgi:hypothetical protein